MSQEPDITVHGEVHGLAKDHVGVYLVAPRSNALRAGGMASRLQPGSHAGMLTRFA
jgi:hypothetical protein